MAFNKNYKVFELRRLVVGNEKFDRLPLKKFYIVSFFVGVITSVIALLAKLILPPEIPLFYGLPQTGQRVTTSIYLVLPPLISVVLTVINAYISMFTESTYLKKVLAFSTIVVSSLVSITVIKIILLVGNI